MKNKLIIILAVVVSILTVGFVIWARTASVTRIALVNFQQFQTTSIVKANTDRFVRYEEVQPEEFRKLGKYDFVLGFGMGMRITGEQRDMIKKAADKGIPVLITASTNPENNICSLDSLQRAMVESYLGSGNRQNYKNLALYIRKDIDRKQFFVTDPNPPVESVSDVLYHLDDQVWFENVADYEKYLRDNKFYQEGGARVAVVGGLNDPFSGNRANIDSLIVSFQRAGMNIFPVSSFMRRLDFLRQIEPDAVIYFAHGRLAMGQADAAVEWLRQRNIPLFSPISILGTRDSWEEDPMGMSGGFMSQSMVVPELDGAIYPYAINAQQVDKDGLYLFTAMPDRLGDFTRIVRNFTALKRKANSEKKLAIYYFKGPGQETLSAQGLETVPSLYNLLKRLKAEGYTVDGLPAELKSFERMLMSQGAIFSPYAEGAFDDYITNGKPALVSKSDYETWVRNSLPADLYDDVLAVYGQAPGRYMSVVRNQEPHLAVARIQLGNIALLPQPLAGMGDDSFAIIHGAKTAPPHTYIAAYLWSRYAFDADAILHYGTHGSLEFTPGKQVALGNYDWPDRLVGTVPHFYYYTIGNIGESMMAKRRSYATTISYLTPPFMESNMRSQFKTLNDKINAYWQSDESSRQEASLAVKKIAVGMGVHRELRLDSILINPYTSEEVEKIENFAEEIANEKMTGRLYTSGVPFETDKLLSTVTAMAADPVAYSLAALDKTRGKISEQQLKNKPFFTKNYLDPAKDLVAQVMRGRKADDAMISSVAGISQQQLLQAHNIISPPRRGPMQMRGSPSGNKEVDSTPGAGVGKDDAPSRSGHPGRMSGQSQGIAEREPVARVKDNGQSSTDAMTAGTSRSGHPGGISPGSTANNGGHPEGIPKGGSTGSRPEGVAQNGAGNSGGHPSGMHKDAASGGHHGATSVTNASGHSAGASGAMANAAGHRTGIPRDDTKPQTDADARPVLSPGGRTQSMEYSDQQKKWARAVVEVERTIKNIKNYKTALELSPELEMSSLLNALSGGYIEPSSGGDAVANPLAVPTGRNLYAVNAEATPSEQAWEKGVDLARATLDVYFKKHGRYPKKVSYTFWSSEFIETEGVTIAQVLYMLGVEPVRDAFGRVSDLQIIPSEELGRPRIDIVVQTSGQFRDLAASRLALISRAVEMAAYAGDDHNDNYVAGSSVEIERQLVGQGTAPKIAREMSTQRVFGGVNGMYGTGIQEMVTSGDRWEDEKEIADTYINNVGALYGSDKDWGEFHEGLLRAVLHNTDVVVQPRQSNTWGALSLDHVFEFMGGLNLAVREVTGKDPDAYFADYRNRHNVRMQELKEAIGVESRSTIFNPTYIKELMKGSASSASRITEVVTNTYGWNVMKPDVIDNEMWDEIHDVYVRDKHELGVRDFYRNNNPAAMQEITAVMMETARKGMWKATEQHLAELAKLHTELVRDFGPSGSGFAGSNQKLQDFIARMAPENSAAYKRQLDVMKNATDVKAEDGMVLKKESMNDSSSSMSLNGLLIIGIVAVVFIAMIVVLRKKRK